MFLAHVEGVGEGDGGVEEEEVVLGLGVGGEVVEGAVASEAGVVEFEFLAVLALAAVGGIAAGGRRV